MLSDSVRESYEKGDVPYFACNYHGDEEVPFAPDGNAPMIFNYIEKVRGTCVRFKNLQAVRKTVIIDTEPDIGLRNVQKRRLTQEAKPWD